MVVDSEIHSIAITLRRYLTPLQQALSGWCQVLHIPTGPPLLRAIQIESCTAYKIVIKHHGKERTTIVTAENHINHLKIYSARGPQL